LSALFAGHLIMSSATAIYSLYRTLRPFRIGVYGPSLTGKTTLDQYLTVPGDMDPIPLEMRTMHPLDKKGNFRMPHSTRKQVRLIGDRKSISSCDLAGQEQFRNLWVEDMIGRNVELVIYMIDDRALHSPQFIRDSVVGLQYLTENMLGKRISPALPRKIRKKARDYSPRLFCLMVNKVDMWWNEDANILHSMNLLREHSIISPYRESLKKIRKAGIRAEIEPISAMRGINVERSMIRLIEKM
jgi:GTPase SAR1 family protein